jgi:UDP-glucuronate 4-epimerase
MTLIEKHFGKPVKYKLIRADKGDVASSADITKAKKLLGYEPKMDLEEGVRRQVEVFKLMPEWYKTLDEV